MTASRVANGLANVRPAKRDAVVRAMRELNYAPHAAAQSMRTRKTRRIAFMLPDITNMTNAAVSQAVERHLAQDRYHLMMFNTDFQTAIECDVLAMAGHNMFDGLIALLTNETDPSVVAALAAAPVPVVLIDRDCGLALDGVYSNHRDAMREVIGHLADLGHRRIALLAPSRSVRPGWARVEAFVAAMAELGIPIDDELVWADDQSIQFGRQVTLSLMRSPAPPTALIAGANQLMMGAYQALRELEIAIPDALSFVGTDDPYLASLLSPPITVIYRDMEMVGRLAAELILQRLRGASDQGPRIITVPSEIAWRSSTGRASDS